MHATEGRNQGQESQGRGRIIGAKVGMERLELEETDENGNQLPSGTEQVSLVGITNTISYPNHSTRLSYRTRATVVPNKYHHHQVTRSKGETSLPYPSSPRHLSHSMPVLSCRCSIRWISKGNNALNRKRENHDPKVTQAAEKLIRP